MTAPRVLRSRPILARVVLLSGALAALPSAARAYELVDPAGSCTTMRWKPKPQIELRWDTGGNLNQGEVSIIRSALETFNQLPNARIFIAETSAPCDLTQGQQTNVICIGGSDAPCGDADGNGCFVPDPIVDSTKCTLDGCRVWLKKGNTTSKLWESATHEVAHCLGLGHTPNTSDWMHDEWRATIHVGMTRDTMNGLSYLYPFGTNFYFGNFDAASADSDLLTRDNKALSDTVPWYLTTSHVIDDAWTDSGQVLADYGDESTLTYLFGDFTGDGCPDTTRAICESCDPGDGQADVVKWGARAGDCASGFGSFSIWANDFGDGEDHDQYRVGDFDGDGCDDVWLIHNLSAPDCATCQVQLQWLLARRPTGSSCASSGAAPDHFVVHGTQVTTTVTERSAASALPWVVGDFYTADGLGCDDVVLGYPDQADPREFSWKVYKAVDSNANGLCDTLASAGVWAVDWGQLGRRHIFAANAGNGAADDLIMVGLPLVTDDEVATWLVFYSNGSNDLTNAHTALADHLVSGAEDHWTGMVFGIGEFDLAVNGAGIDFITLRGADAAGAVKAKIAYRAAGSGSWSLSHGTDQKLPTSQASWDQPTDEDFDGNRDNGGDDVKDAWWCQDCDHWYCSTCSGCCP